MATSLYIKPQQNAHGASNVLQWLLGCFAPSTPVTVSFLDTNGAVVLREMVKIASIGIQGDVIFSTVAGNKIDVTAVAFSGKLVVSTASEQLSFDLRTNVQPVYVGGLLELAYAKVDIHSQDFDVLWKEAPAICLTHEWADTGFNFTWCKHCGESGHWREGSVITEAKQASV